MSANGADLQRARMVARERGLTEERCRGCRGARVLTYDDANEPTGKGTTDPCPSCDGFGVYWYEGTTSTILHRTKATELLG